MDPKDLPLVAGLFYVAPMPVGTYNPWLTIANDSLTKFVGSFALVNQMIRTS